ncbi:MAG: L,D-transpeptidase, partial [Devosia sp.]
MTAAVLVHSRRAFLAGGASLAALTLAGCATSRRLEVIDRPQFSEYYLQMYGPIPGERFRVPAIDLSKLDP